MCFFSSLVQEYYVRQGYWWAAPTGVHAMRRSMKMLEDEKLHGSPHKCPSTEDHDMITGLSSVSTSMIVKITGLLVSPLSPRSPAPLDPRFLLVLWPWEIYYYLLEWKCIAFFDTDSQTHDVVTSGDNRPHRRRRLAPCTSLFGPSIRT